MTTLPDLDPTSAMTLVAQTTDAFSRLPWNHMTPEMQKGALLLFDDLLQRAKPLLPPDLLPDVFNGIATAHRVASAVREILQLRRREVH